MLAFQDGILLDILKSAPQAVTAILVLVTVFAFLKHMRTMSKEFLTALEKRDEKMAEALKELAEESKSHRAETVRILEVVRGR